MAASTAVRFQVVDGAPRRVGAVAPVARPELGAPPARPVRPAAPGCARPAASCAVRGRVPIARFLRVKVAAVAALTTIGLVVSTAQFIQNAQPDPTQGYVAGDPAWAHVAQP